MLQVKNKYLSAASQPSGHSASQTFVIHEDDDVDQPMASVSPASPRYNIPDLFNMEAIVVALSEGFSMVGIIL